MQSTTPDEVDLDTHPGAWIFVLENTIDEKGHSLNDAIREALSAPAQTIEGMLTKVRIAMREVLGGAPKQLAVEVMPPLAGYSNAADNALRPEGIVVSLWADLTRLFKDGWELTHPPTKPPAA